MNKPYGQSGEIGIMFVVTWLVGLVTSLIYLGILIFLLYVAWHFVGKYW